MQLKQASGKVLALVKQVNQHSEALKSAHKEGARAKREAAQADSAEKDIASLREELSRSTRTARH